jgi:hypothetical protein
LSAELKVTFADSVTSEGTLPDLELRDIWLLGGAITDLGAADVITFEEVGAGLGVLVTEGFLRFSWS